MCRRTKNTRLPRELPVCVPCVQFAWQCSHRIRHWERCLSSIRVPELSILKTPARKDTMQTACLLSLCWITPALTERRERFEFVSGADDTIGDSQSSAERSGPKGMCRFGSTLCYPDNPPLRFPYPSKSADRSRACCERARVRWILRAVQFF